MFVVVVLLSCAVFGLFFVWLFGCFGVLLNLIFERLMCACVTCPILAAAEHAYRGKEQRGRHRRLHRDGGVSL